MEERKMSWDCLVITCPPDGRAAALQKEMELVRSRGWLAPEVPILTAEDPAPAAGSGTATLNALLVAAEFLSLCRGYSVVTADVFLQSRVLVLHHGRRYPWECRGKAFVDLPLQHPKEEESGRAHALDNCLWRLLDLAEKVSREEESGVWVCSTDALLLSPLEWEAEEKKEADAKLFYVLAEVGYATGHGVIRMDSQGRVLDVLYCGREEVVSRCCLEDGRVPLVAGMVYLSSRVAESLSSLHSVSPLDSCNYMGLDSGARPLQVSLFFDLLIAMASDVSEDNFLSGRCGKTYNQKFGPGDQSEKRTVRARRVVWECLSPYKMIAVGLKNYGHFYWSEEESGRRHAHLLHQMADRNLVHSYLQREKITSEDCIILNSWLSVGPDSQIGPGSIMYHTCVAADVFLLGRNCFLNGLTLPSSHTKIAIPDETVIIGFKVSLPNSEAPFARINVIVGCDDILTIPLSDNQSTFCNCEWNQVFERTGICADDLWDKNLEDDKKTLLNAKLYWVSDEILEQLLFTKREGNWNEDQYRRWKNRERFSIDDILKFINYEEEFKSRRELYASIALEEISRILLNNSDNPVLLYFRTAHIEGWDKRVLSALDEVCLKSASKIEIISRTLSCIADLLGLMAGMLGGVRSGPGNNRLWISAFNLLQEGKIEAGLRALKAIRDQWLDRPHRIIRAARHYESALQIIIRKAVTTANQFVQLSKVPLLPFNQYVVVECPARVDLQGGWSDTPPICYELGGSVVNMAVLINRKKPIGAKACRITDLEIIMNLGENELAPTLTINHLNQLLDYNQPNAEAALLKAAVVYTGLVDVEGDAPLSQQLRSKYGGGFQMAAWSLLPRGSGMGTSSIMASAILAALWTITGHSYCHESLIHAVLQLEQLLTTGGGWQDQVGGVVGGIKRGLSEPGLPLHVLVEEARTSQEFLKRFEDHFLLVYTGKVRLAKNLLQNVIRNWYAREQKVVKCFGSLLQNSSRMLEAFHSEDLEKIGHLMNAYWEQKQWLAPGCRPDLVRDMTTKLQPLTYGQCLVGAGGGGFLCLLTRYPHQADAVKDIISQVKDTEKVEVWMASICRSGMETRLEPAKV